MPSRIAFTLLIALFAFGCADELDSTIPTPEPVSAAAPAGVVEPQVQGATSPDDEIAIFKGSKISLVDAWTGEERAIIAGEWPCLHEVRAAPTRFYCYQADGPVRVALETQEPTPIDWAPTGMVAPAVRARTYEQHSSLDGQVPATGLRQVGLSPDGQFRYFVEEGLRGPTPILVDDGSGPRPAMNDPRDQYRLWPSRPDLVDLEFIDHTTVIWRSNSTGSSTADLMGRIDENGMILDVATTAEGVEDYDVLAVMTSRRDLEIDENLPLIALMDEHDQPFEGGWFVGNTLAEEPACGAKTLYRTTADGYGRVLPAAVELDEPVDVQATNTLQGINVDSVSTHRVVAISVRCPEFYDGVRVHLFVEVIDYGDGGPRSGPFTGPLQPDAIQLLDGTDTFAAVTGVSAVGRDCSYNHRIEIGLETLDGRRLVVEVSQWQTDNELLEPLDRTEVGDAITDEVVCEAE